MIRIATAQSSAATVQNVGVTAGLLVERLVAPGGEDSPEHEGAET